MFVFKLKIYFIYSAFRTSSGWTSWKAKVPKGTVNWKLSTFTIDPNVGLTILEPKPFTIISSKKQMYLIVNVPYRIRVGKYVK